MKRALRILGFVALSFVALVLLAYGVVYAVSQSRVGRTFPAPRSTIAIPGDSASVAEGERLARIRGCTGCHGALAQGDTFVNDWVIARVMSPNLTQAVRRYSVEELEGIIRHGVRPDGKSVVVMPSGMFLPLTDRDLGAILSYLRSLPASDGPTRDVRLGPLARVMFAIGKFLPAAVESDSAVKLASSYPPTTDANWRGAYLARTSCTECHGLDLRGDPSGKPPDLRIAASYPLDAFKHLMRTGKAPGDRQLGLMSEMSKRFSRFTDQEIEALHAYLVARAKFAQ